MLEKIKTVLFLAQEIEAKLIPNRQSKRRGGEIHRIVGTLELICGISMLVQEWRWDPKELLVQLEKELETE
jgi:hypothetical protein